jgi:hypothetical protein
MVTTTGPGRPSTAISTARRASAGRSAGDDGSSTALVIEPNAAVASISWNASRPRA